MHIYIYCSVDVFENTHFLYFLFDFQTAYQKLGIILENEVFQNESHKTMSITKFRKFQMSFDV